MATLLLRLSAPLQSWGIQSDYVERDTGREPSKSGVIGLLCAALGRPRTAPLSDLTRLRMGLRVDQEGVVRADYHTAGKGGYYKVDGGVERNRLITSNRAYLHDARFLVGLEGDWDMLSSLQHALMRPTWFLFLGRKACIPSERIWLPDGLQDLSLITALQRYPWLGNSSTPPERLRLMIEDPNGAMIRNDQPISFVPRRYMPRRITVSSVMLPSNQAEE
ncbi:type I-E CRISPR-associated protein Cas5/CasD [Anaerolineae bacterium CFX9]|nr:type I-E CRISPR-associated protein Cas5/CasD [Anaerolineae bacterium CFX9]